MAIAIKAENVSKAYQLGEFSTGTLSKDIERWWHLKRGKEDPYLLIGETNDRTIKGSSNIVWSLKDINFEVKQGDAIGIIGRNGAGKSTLLKILSRVTTPTKGSMKIKGRIASLLEVGTGFHPELTGRENVFLNGAILGLRKKEILRKFDEILDFSGIERYIDTPVKRYSSGMYVRLAFAVAAHLESEILIVDEVLAVGDAEFQKKCLGKMNFVSMGEGRTVLFVSHNLSAVRQLCHTGIYLKQGQIYKEGKINDVINDYLNDTPLEMSSVINIDIEENNNADKHAYITKIIFNNGDDIFYGKPLTVDVYFNLNKPALNLIAAVAITNIDGARVATYDSEVTTHIPHYFSTSREGVGKITFHIDRVFLQPTYYKIDVGLRDTLLNTYDVLYGCGTIEIKADKDTPLVLCELSEPGSLRQPIQTTSSFL